MDFPLPYFMRARWCQPALLHIGQVGKSPRAGWHCKMCIAIKPCPGEAGRSWEHPRKLRRMSNYAICLMNGGSRQRKTTLMFSDSFDQLSTMLDAENRRPSETIGGPTYSLDIRRTHKGATRRTIDLASLRRLYPRLAAIEKEMEVAWPRTASICSMG